MSSIDMPLSQILLSDGRIFLGHISAATPQELAISDAVLVIPQPNGNTVLQPLNRETTGVEGPCKILFPANIVTFDLAETSDLARAYVECRTGIKLASAMPPQQSRGTIRLVEN